MIPAARGRVRSALYDSIATALSCKARCREFRRLIQRFVDGDAAETADGGADIYGLGSPDGLMINPATGEIIWDAVVRIADAAGLAIMPIGCPVCVTGSELLDDLPRELRPETRLVSSGSELRDVISG